MESWDTNWEKIFQTKEWGKYPPEELVRFIARNFYKRPNRNDVKILDLGCGTGAATWFIAREGFSAYGVDGSKTAIEIAKKRFKEEKLEANFSVQDFIKLDFKDNYCDAVIDISAIQHNTPENQKMIMDEIFRVLKPGGKIFSMMLSNKTKLTRNNNHRTDEIFIHLSDKNEIKYIFSKFKNLIIETSERTDRGLFMSHFVISADK